jgi:hypothetical protein
VEYGFQQAIAARFVVPRKPVIQVVDPDVRELHRMIETFQALRTHASLLVAEISCSTEFRAGLMQL